MTTPNTNPAPVRPLAKTTTLKVNLPKSHDLLVKGLEQVQPAYGQFKGDMYAGLIPIDRIAYDEIYDENGIDGDEINYDQKGELQAENITNTGGEGQKRIGNTMFWLFEPTVQSVEQTIVVWMNGGPGCSSFNCGVLMEHSPVTQPLHNAGYCCLQSHPMFDYNPHTWTRATTMLYVEHPIGTGFSHGYPYPFNEIQACGDLYSFLQNFMDVFPKFRSYTLFVMGESYAGMFIPSMARYIHLQNKQQTNKSRIIKLGGAAIGNGWMDGRVQGPAVIDYSWWHGLIDEPTRNALHEEWGHCMNKSVSMYGEQPPFHPFNVQDDCGIMWGVLQASGNPNAYDVTTWDPNVDQVTFSSEVFYNNPIVKTALHAPMNITWHGCIGGAGRRLRERRQLLIDQGDSKQADVLLSNEVHLTKMEHYHRSLYMDNDRPINVVPYVADLLNDGVPVLVYNGDRDMTTCSVGSEKILNQMTEWKDHSGWADAKRGVWMKAEGNGNQAGWAKEHKGLTFVVVYNSGHMVPYNVPEAAFDLLQRFLRHESFVDDEAPLIRFNPPQPPPPAADTTIAGTGVVGTSTLPMSTTLSSMLSTRSSSSSSGAGLDGINNNVLAHQPLTTSIHQFHATMFFAMLVAFVSGGMLTWFFTTRRERRHRRQGYQAVHTEVSLTL